mmetsp:Transcript_7001/g.10199  ORF Transcript_7001/g.10199 Transcript_7001/m.10199 type:complete len:182 (+) Transcript_7001:4036-4581(+)
MCNSRFLLVPVNVESFSSVVIVKSKCVDPFINGAKTENGNLVPRRAHSTLMIIVASPMKPWGAFGTPGAFGTCIQSLQMQSIQAERKSTLLVLPCLTSSRLLSTLWNFSAASPPDPLVSVSPRKRFKKSVRSHDICRMFDRGRSRRIMTYAYLHIFKGLFSDGLTVVCCLEASPWKLKTLV